jgi:hypothetical protein
MILAALQATRVVTNTAERPVNASSSKLTPTRTLPKPAMRTASVKHQEVCSPPWIGR